MPSKRVLVVEDERPLAHALELKLIREGFEVKVVVNGQDALDAINKEQFAVVLLDMMMPVLDGFQVLAQIKNKPHRPTIFVLSNLSQPQDASRVLDAGAAKYFIKSDTPLAVLIQEVKKAAV